MEGRSLQLLYYHKVQDLGFTRVTHSLSLSALSMTNRMACASL
jgi:hypothetical protein